jgi:hypothetical protein
MIKEIRFQISEEDWSEFKFFHRIQNFLISYAGFDAPRFKNISNPNLNKELQNYKITIRSKFISSQVINKGILKEPMV